MAADPLGLVGNSLGGYRVEAFVASGAFAFVYRASRNGDIYALKILNPGAGAIQILEFENEGTLLFKLAGCGGVVDIVESLDETAWMTGAGGLHFSVRLRFHVLSIADGCLDELVADVAALDWPSRLSLFRDLVLGVHQMHVHGLVHRDLKAANALLFLRKGGLTTRISDLGRARDLSEPAAAAPPAYLFTRGDPNFAAPEFVWQIGLDSADTHKCADLYGLGSMLFELTLGQGFSAMALFPHYANVVPDLSLAESDRRSAYASRVSEIRSWFEATFQLFEQSTPSVIRPQAGRLLRQLCDPDPRRRLPQIRPGERGRRRQELNWLIARADILRLTLANHNRQQQKLLSRKGTRA